MAWACCGKVHDEGAATCGACATPRPAWAAGAPPGTLSVVLPRPLVVRVEAVVRPPPPVTRAAAPAAAPAAAG